MKRLIPIALCAASLPGLALASQASIEIPDKIGGPDQNDNGVRDDVDQYIQSLSINDDQATAMRQVSRWLSEAMRAGRDRIPSQQAIHVAEQSGRAIRCLRRQVSDQNRFMNLYTGIRDQTIDTRARAAADKTFSRMVTGASLEGGGRRPCTVSRPE